MASSFDHGRGALRIHAVVVVAGLRCDATEASAASDVLSEGLGGGGVGGAPGIYMALRPFGPRCHAKAGHRDFRPAKPPFGGLRN